MSGDPEDFSSMMASMGVRPLSKKGARPPGRKSAGRPLKGVDRPPAPARPAPGPKPVPPKPVAPPPPTFEQQRAELQRRILARDGEIRARDEELQALRAKLAAAEEATEAVEKERQREQFTRVTAEESVERLRDRLQSGRAGERTTLRALEETQSELRAVRADFQGRVARTVRAVLQTRGCADLEEEQTVLGALLTRRPEDLLGSLTPGEDLPALLEDRVQFLCGRSTCPQDPSCVMLLVPAARCEICGGSDTRAAFEALVRRADERGGLRLTIVGGSPAYRKQLRELANPHRALKIELVSGTQRRPRSKAEADLKRSDFVVLWGATMLDHSVTDAYSGASGRKLLRVPHRGISGMLRALGEALG